MDGAISKIATRSTVLNYADLTGATKWAIRLCKQCIPRDKVLQGVFGTHRCYVRTRVE